MVNVSPSVNGRTGQEPGTGREPSSRSRQVFPVEVDRNLEPGAACDRGAVHVVAVEVGDQQRVHVVPGAVGLREGGHESPLGRQPRVDQQDGPRVLHERQVPGTPAAQRRDMESHCRNRLAFSYRAYLVKTKSFPLTFASCTASRCRAPSRPPALR